ncbi:unnamed protein product [Mycena citricolor]|uniref:Uncharacterized protein n=1 Tax=Mycena citricolor TaxID=2018698 RepID=A0AAD2HID3_9AGAR|nr:unnamed protein product [Mycena citricolor]
MKGVDDVASFSGVTTNGKERGRDRGESWKGVQWVSVNLPDNSKLLRETP